MVLEGTLEQIHEERRKGKNGIIRIAFPDGHLYPMMREIAGYAGLSDFPDEKNKSFTDSTLTSNGIDIPLEQAINRPRAIARHLKNGVYDIGIVGLDTTYDELLLKENGQNGNLKIEPPYDSRDLKERLRTQNLEYLASLDFRPSYSYLAVPRDFGYKEGEFDKFLADYTNGKAIGKIVAASEFLHIAKSFLDYFGIKYEEIYRTDGATENNLIQGGADLIIDVGETGNSIRKAGGVILTAVIQESYPLLLANRDSYTKYQKQIEIIKERIMYGKRKKEENDPKAFEIKDPHWFDVLNLVFDQIPFSRLFRKGNGKSNGNGRH